MIGVLVLVEAIQSTAMSHHGGCPCDTCAAAGGDQEALARLLMSIQIRARDSAPAASKEPDRV